jgi:hypothetical protein
MRSRAEIAARHSILAKPGYEVLPWVYYDYQAYPAAGQALLTYFQTPRGQGGRTARDTNFPGAGSLPSGYEFFIDEIGLQFLPGVNPGTFGAPQAGTFVNDLWKVGSDGWLEFTLLSKKIIQEGPLGNFPSSYRMMGFAAAADASTAAANLQTLVNYAAWGGKPRRMNSTMLEANVSFDVTANWNAAVALPSGQAGRLGVLLAGMLRRKLQ